MGGLDIPAAAPAGKKTFLLLSVYKKVVKKELFIIMTEYDKTR